MNSARLMLSSVFLAVLASYAAAATPGAFVSSGGNDTNPCSRAAPCRTIQAAINAVTSGGTVVALDSAWFGSNVTINKSVSVTAPPGVFAGISVASGDGITIKLPSSVVTGRNEYVTLQGLTITSQLLGGNGVVFSSGDQLEIEKCVIHGFSSAPNSRGVFFNSTGKLFVKDTIVQHNSIGIETFTTSSTVLALAHMDNVSAVHNGTGIRIGAGTNAAIRNSTLSGNSGTGILVDGFISAGGNFGPNTGPALVDIDGCLMTNNGTGIGIGTGSASISNCTISHNVQFGFSLPSGPGSGFGVIFSRGNNTIIGNAANSGILEPLNPQ
jgi:hypothetical protein